ncbi:hypothetical protein Lalb_Chr19g0129521 [Lupinus albus]|uniref:Uncharacterized protein n=1 Tax=Lupinus albus TaxID=3870 RepID=A0A6A4NTT7_LUPAL|nr:hypothetical protein Lalb_Chr19g0129521 [Lupinus albus]
MKYKLKFLKIMLWFALTLTFWWTRYRSWSCNSGWCWCRSFGWYWCRCFWWCRCSSFGWCWGWCFWRCRCFWWCWGWCFGWCWRLGIIGAMIVQNVLI